MNPHENKVMALPPHPPAAVNTVASSIVGVGLSLCSMAISFYIGFFPHNAPVEMFFGATSAFLIFVTAFVVGVRALKNETKRAQFQHVVLEYTRISGDKRYMPYILPTHTTLVTTLFVITVALPIMQYLSGLMAMGTSNV